MEKSESPQIKSSRERERKRERKKKPQGTTNLASAVNKSTIARCQSVYFQTQQPLMFRASAAPRALRAPHLTASGSSPSTGTRLGGREGKRTMEEAGRVPRAWASSVVTFCGWRSFPANPRRRRGLGAGSLACYSPFCLYFVVLQSSYSFVLPSFHPCVVKSAHCVCVWSLGVYMCFLRCVIIVFKQTHLEVSPFISWILECQIFPTFSTKTGLHKKISKQKSPLKYFPNISLYALFLFWVKTFTLSPVSRQTQKGRMDKLCVSSFQW